MHNLIQTLIILVIAGCASGVYAQYEQLSPGSSHAAMVDSAGIWFNNLKINSLTPGRNPWPVDIYGKTMIVEPDSRFLVANSQNLQNSFTGFSDLFVGYLDKNHGIANTSKQIYDEMWTMVDVNYLNGKNPNEISWILAHESFHRIQHETGLPSANPENTHLETKDGRILLQLELRALQKALRSEGQERIIAIEDALRFRYRRFGLFENAETEECRFEMHEGMAEYTGARFSGYDRKLLHEVVAEKLKQAEVTKNLKWFFAYLTGPAYGLLLDDFYPEWISSVTVNTNIAKLLQTYSGIDISSRADNNIHEMMGKYDGNAIIEKEDSIYQAKINARKHYAEKYLNDTTLIIFFAGQMRISFDPMNAFDLGEAGTIYPGKSHVSDQWGVLETNEDLLLGKDWRYLILTKPISISGHIIKGDTWQLLLNEPWMIESENGNFKIVKQNKKR